MCAAAPAGLAFYSSNQVSAPKATASCSDQILLDTPSGDPLGRFSAAGECEPSSQLLKQRGIFGETMLHSCILCIGAATRDHRKRERATRLAQYLISHFNPRARHDNPLLLDLVNAQYDACQGEDSMHFCERPCCFKGQHGPYDGETALHMVRSPRIQDVRTKRPHTPVYG